jgi:hypothetical protein
MHQSKAPILAAAASLVRQKPPPPPQELSSEEKKQWYNITMNMPADWFPPETWHVLVELCRHICQSTYFYTQLQKIQARRGALNRDDTKVMKDLTVLHLMETKMITHLSVRLKIAQPAIYDAASKRAARMSRFGVDRKPWELPATETDFEPVQYTDAQLRREYNQSEIDNDPEKFGSTFSGTTSKIL